MRLTRFAVKGFKNFRETVTLDAMSGLDVIHGENNVGKSNLLQAIDLFFFLLDNLLGRHETPVTEQSATSVELGNSMRLLGDEDGHGVSFHLNEGQLKNRGYAADDIFNFESPVPIELQGAFEVLADDVVRGGAPDSPLRAFAVSLLLTRSHRGCVDAQMVLSVEDAPMRWRAVRSIAMAAVNNFETRSDVRARGFILVDTLRRVVATDGNESDRTLRLPLTHQLLLALYDAKESVEPGLFQRWELFEQAMNSLGHVVGNGRFVITYNRNEQRAILAVQRGKHRIPIETMGSGVQQIASLLARVLLANSAIVAVEEPELNLRYEMQLRVRDMLREILRSGLGPQQIILTSHSPAFESGPTFYAMSLSEGSPAVVRRPVADAPSFLQLVGMQPPIDGGAYGYVTSEGLLRLSSDIRAVLGVERGGGVVVLKRGEHAYVEILTNEQFASLLHRGEPGA